MNKKIITAALAWALVAPLVRSQTIETVTSAAAGLYEPYGVGVDLNLNAYYFTDSANDRVVRIQPQTGKASVLLDHQLFGPQGIVVTANGIYITESASHSIVRMSLDGELTAVAGGTRGANNGLGAAAQFNSPAGIAADAAGNLYVADLKNNAIRKVTALGEVTTYATGFNEPSGVAVDDAGVVYVADTRNHVIKRITAAGATPEVIAGISKQPGIDDGFGGSATFNNPRGLAWAGGETGLLVSDTGNHSIRKVYFKSGVWRVQTVAGKSGEPGFLPGSAGAPTEGRFNGPVGLAVDAEGSILVCDLYNNALRAIKRELVATPEISPVSGSYSNTVSLVITSSTTNVLFHYTLNGSDPNPFSPSTTKNLEIDGGPISLKLRGYSPDFGTSIALSNRYSFFVNPPVMFPAGGSFTNDTPVSIFEDTKNAELRYTTDGSVPVSTSPKWDATTATISSNVTLRVRGFRTGFDPSDILSNRFDFAVAPLLISVPGGVFNNIITNIILTTPTAGTDLRYTTDGREPTLLSPIWTNGLFVNGLLWVKAFKTGYTPTTITNLFRFVVGDPIVAVPTLSSSNAIPISISTITTGANLYYTFDGTDPTNASPLQVVGGKLNVDHNGPLKIRGFRDGFEPSTIYSNNFALKVANPVITPGSTNSFNPINITLTDATEQSKIYWTIDGTDPTESSNKADSGVPFVLATSGVLKARAFRENFSASDISTADFRFIFAPLKLEPAGGTNVNSITFAVTSETTGSPAGTGLYYTTDGTEPSKTSAQYTGPKALGTNALVKVIGIRDGFASSAVVSADFRVKAPKPTMSPSNGYFPNGTVVTLVLSEPRVDAQIRYTLDGSDPTETSALYVAPFSVNQVVSPGQDLRQVRARAFAPNTLPSDIVFGQPVDDNVLGVPRNMNAGIGSTIVMPVVLNLKSNLVLRSLQFVVEVSPDTATTKPLGNDLRGLNLSTNDFVSMRGPGASGPAVISSSVYRSGTTSGITISAIGTNANFAVSDFGTVAMLAVTLPPNSAVGDRYLVKILEPSGTTNALQAKVALKAMDDRFITVTNISYIVGDTAPGNWYNAGDFGDGNLDNSDVNNAFYASLGIRIPFSFSDVFDAMDAYPDDDVGAVGGDGQIRFLDWQRILQKSLRRNTKNWQRQWSAGGSRTTVAATLVAQASLSASVQRGFNRDIWYREAVVRAGTLARVEPNSTVDVPVYLDVRKGNTIAGLQFRVQVESDGVPLQSPITFVAAKGMPKPLSADGLSVNETVASWPLVPSSPFTPALSKANLLGSVRINVPANAAKGQRYTVHFLHTDGSPDENTQYEIESLPGNVWVGVDAQSPDEKISDEWKQFYFGSLLDPRLATDEDSDGDEASNLAEYLAGTNPLNSHSRLQLSTPEIRHSGGVEELVLKWQTAPGRGYVVEWAADVKGGVWNVLGDDVDGDGDVHEVSTPSLATSASFYRVRLKN